MELDNVNIATFLAKQELELIDQDLVTPQDLEMIIRLAFLYQTKTNEDKQSVTDEINRIIARRIEERK
jgi:hypothetical protein